MLVLRRKVNESIVIAGEVRVRVLAIERGVVKIGIEAPGDIQVIREELLERAQKKEMEIVNG